MQLGQPADGYLKTQSFEEIPEWFDAYGQIKSDGANRLWASSNGKIEIYQAPLAIGAQPIKILSGDIPTLDGDTIKLFDIHGPCTFPANGEFVWVSESFDHCIFELKTPSPIRKLISFSAKKVLLITPGVKKKTPTIVIEEKYLPQLVLMVNGQN